MLGEQRAALPAPITACLNNISRSNDRDGSMTRYFFDLLAPEGWIEDGDGTSLSNVNVAVEHARVVAHELMKGAERSSRYWRLRIRAEDGTSFGELLFASVDPTLDHLGPQLRTVIEAVSWNFGELTQRAIEMDGQRYEFRASLARMRRQPFLVTIGGHRVATIAAESENRPIVLPPRLVAMQGQVIAKKNGGRPPKDKARRQVGPEPARVNLSRPFVDRGLALQHLAKAEQHVVDGEGHVRNQRKIVARIEQWGHDPTESKRLLALFEELYAGHVAYRDQLADEVSRSATA
jgi:hypothetical protein